MRGIRTVAALAGYELTARTDGALVRLARAGIQPTTIIDIGAALGDWSRACALVFPHARYVLVEPLDEFGPALDLTLRSLDGVRIAAAASSTPEQRTFHVHRDLVGSSLLREREGEHVDGEPRAVEVTTVDAIVDAQRARPPFLLKVDVQGAELDVLAGAARTLPDVDAVVVEVSFFSFYFDGSQFDRLVATMSEAGFAVFDIENLSRRPLDGALGQADVVFVREDSPARREHVYASPDQRVVQDAEFAETMRRRLERAQRRL